MEQTKPPHQAVTRSPTRKVGRVNSPWFQDRPIDHESQLEKSFIKSAQFVPGISTITSQPFRLSLPDGRSYTPDFLLVSRCGTFKAVVEVKGLAFLEGSIRTNNQASMALAQKGLLFYVVTEESIYGRSADIAEIIGRYGKAAYSEVLVSKLVESLQATGLSTAADLAASVGADVGLVWHAVARRLAFLADDSLPSEHSLVRSAPTIEDPRAAFEKRFGVAPWMLVAPTAPKRRRTTELKRRPKAAPLSVLNTDRLPEQIREQLGVPRISGGQSQVQSDASNARLRIRLKAIR